jgi:hypothetical protein
MDQLACFAGFPPAPGGGGARPRGVGFDWERGDFAAATAHKDKDKAGRAPRHGPGRPWPGADGAWGASRAPERGFSLRAGACGSTKGHGVYTTKGWGYTRKLNK